MAQLTVDELKKIPLFENLTDKQLPKLLTIMTYITFQKDEKIIIDGDLGDSAFILLEGEIEITKQMTLLPESMTGTNEKSLIKLKGAYKPTIGELSLFDEHAKRTATVRTLEKSEFASIKRSDFLKLTESDFEIGYRIMMNVSKTLASRLQKANVDIMKLTTAFTLALTSR